MKSCVLAALAACTNAPAIPACTTAPTPIAAPPTPTTAIAMPVEQIAGDGTLRFAVPIQIGDAPPLMAFLDTGSSGLRILPNTIPDDAYECATTESVSERYHSGLELTGIVAYARVAIGGVAEAQPIAVQYVENRDDDVFGPFRAIVGVGMRNMPDGISSPIAQLPGEPAFVVRAGASMLELAPSADEVEQFASYQLPAQSDRPALPNGVTAWDDRYGLPACIDDDTRGVSYCVPAMLDTGCPPTYIDLPGVASTTLVAPGSRIGVEIGPTAAPLAEYAFTVGAVPRPGVDKIEIEATSGPAYANLGTAVFAHDDVLFDPKRGVVGFSASNAAL